MANIKKFIPNIKNFFKRNKNNNQPDLSKYKNFDFDNSKMKERETQLTQEMKKNGIGLGPAVPRRNKERQATGPAIPVRKESLVNITNGVNLSNTAGQFGTFKRDNSSTQNQSQSNNAEASTSRASRNTVNSYFTDTQSISQRAPVSSDTFGRNISSDTFGRNNRNSTYTDISNGSSSQTNNRKLQNVNLVDSKVSQQSSRRSSTLGG